METKKRTTRTLDLLSAVEKIVELSKESHLDAEFFKKAARPLKYLSDKLEITKEQSVAVALFIDHSNDYSINVSDFARHFDCSTIRVIRLLPEIDELEKRGFVYSRRDRNSITYRVPLEVIEAFKRNEKFAPRKYTGLNFAEFFALIQEFLEMRNDNEMSTDMTIKRIKDLLENNKHLDFVQKVKNYGFCEEDEMLLILFSHLFINNNDDNIGYHDLHFFFDKNLDWSSVKFELNHDINALQDNKIIEYNNDDGFADRESFRMTWKAKQELFPEQYTVTNHQDKSRKNLIKHEDITAKQLYYDTNVTSQVTDLTRLLEESHYHEICSRLAAKGYRSGFTCLFYGAPGTGKTETALQLARQTGRDIMQVNISEIKSMWVGESEKNIKRIFDEYRSKVEKATLAPILLFNEADAVIGKRQEGAERAVEKMENSIQNIILQEMETLEGILIATTNLAQNMDKAFERRFLYKVKFNKPTLEARMQIWQAMLPELKEEDIRVLAEKYDFSGGQIENIARHYAIDSILHSDSAASLEKLMEHCDSERLEQKDSHKIGFK